MILVIILGGCVGDNPKRNGGFILDSGPDFSLSQIEILMNKTEPVVGFERKGRAGNKSPYVVFDKSYSLLSSNSGFEEEGLASWYGKKFHGRRTSNGEVYDMYQFTAAHRSLLLPAFVRVTNLANGKMIIVRVNDRGPFHEDRVIDLSAAAAVKLGFYKEGVAQVRIKVLEPASESSLSRIEIGDFDKYDAAQDTLKKIQALVSIAAEIVRFKSGSLFKFRIELGPIIQSGESEKLESLIKVMDLPGYRLIEDERLKKNVKTL